jgi:tRNA(Arg) A34 adenosine deaminase TadA
MGDFNKEYYNLKFNKLNKYYINKAIEQSNNSDGGPFGAIIVKDDKIISTGNNKVTVSNDPTAHAEIVAIRNACAKIGNYSLEGCTLYTSCEPCPMCLSAIYWSRINIVYYANTSEDASLIDFDDKEIYEELFKKKDDRKIKMHHLCNTNAIDTFVRWKNNINKIHY